MARPVTWLPRLLAIRRSVADSVRSHYSTRDIEQLFQIQPRSAQMLAALSPTVPVGNAQLIEQEALIAFLDRLVASGDPARELAALRRQPKPTSLRRKLRQLIRTDALVDVSGLPLNVLAERGLLAIRFADMEELATSLHCLAKLLDDDLEGFAGRYEPELATQPTSTEDEREREDVEYIREWLATNAAP